FPDEALPTDSGYLPIDESSESRLFYVYYEASKPDTELEISPIMVWLNGGPGCSSLIGCFYELGPWIVQENFSLQKNPGAWNRRCGILFVDNPIGTGFSIAASELEVPRCQETVALHLHNALSTFMEQKSFTKRPLVLAGESYAGKYLPALAHHILTRKNGNGLSSQLSGVAIGNGLIHPRTQVQMHAEVAFCFGLLDKQQSQYVQELAREVVELIDREDWLAAHEQRTYLCKWIETTSGIPTLLDVRRSSRYHRREDGTDYLAEFLNLPHVRTSLKVDPTALNFACCRKSVKLLMAEDTMKSTKWMLETVLKKGLPVLLYQGVYDAKDGAASSEAWMRSLNWEYVDRFWKSPREIWKVMGDKAGYWRQGRNLTHVVIAGAGHEVPADQPVCSRAMIETWMAGLACWKAKL
ncbi:serine carboxypeptidase-like enzyme, partial [Selaginella moellendorffii]